MSVRGTVFLVGDVVQVFVQLHRPSASARRVTFKQRNFMGNIAELLQSTELVCICKEKLLRYCVKVRVGRFRQNDKSYRPSSCSMSSSDKARPYPTSCHQSPLYTTRSMNLILSIHYAPVQYSIVLVFTLHLGSPPLNHTHRSISTYHHNHPHRLVSDLCRHAFVLIPAVGV